MFCDSTGQSEGERVLTAFSSLLIGKCSATVWRRIRIHALHGCFLSVPSSSGNVLRRILPSTLARPECLAVFSSLLIGKSSATAQTAYGSSDVRPCLSVPSSSGNVLRLIDGAPYQPGNQTFSSLLVGKCSATGIQVITGFPPPLSPSFSSLLIGKCSATSPRSACPPPANRRLFQFPPHREMVCDATGGSSHSPVFQFPPHREKVCDRWRLRADRGTASFSSLLIGKRSAT